MKQIFVLATSLLLVTLYSPHVVFAQEMTPANSSTLPSVDVVKVPAQ